MHSGDNGNIHFLQLYTLTPGVDEIFNVILMFTKNINTVKQQY